VAERCGAGEFAASLEQVAQSDVTDMKTSARGLVQDQAAVEAALSLEWSNGQVGGQVNLLKLLKRRMYGQASFDLLRARVLHAVNPEKWLAARDPKGQIRFTRFTDEPCSRGLTHAPVNS
jgi:predicted DCC family thiol-disulfide oxidoreductase YuxK